MKLEITDAEHPVRTASVTHLANIHGLVAELAASAGIADADGVARQWHILMKGSIVAGAGGDRDAADRGRELGALLLARHGVTAQPHRTAATV